MLQLKFAKMHKDVRIPTKNPADAGYDIYPYFKEEELVIQPFETKVIPTGLKVWIPDGYYLQFFERGSTGIRGIAQRSGVIDSSYTGELLVPITNINNKKLVISKQPIAAKDDIIYYPYNKAITQAILLPVPKSTSIEISLEEIENRVTHRGEGRFGSSGK